MNRGYRPDRIDVAIRDVGLGSPCLAEMIHQRGATKSVRPWR